MLPIAILLPPFYAMVTPIPLYVLTQFWVFRGIVYRRVFTVGAIALSYGAASTGIPARSPARSPAARSAPGCTR